MQNKTEVAGAGTSKRNSDSKISLRLTQREIVEKLMDELPAWWEENPESKNRRGKK